MQTNLYSTQQRVAKNVTTPWQPITKVELIAFIGLNVAQLPALRNYCDSSSSMVLCRDWFIEIMRYFHFVDNTTAPSRSDPNYNKLENSTTGWKAFRNQCTNVFTTPPAVHWWKHDWHKMSFIFYIMANPLKWGIKVWVCSDSVNGYVCSFSIYTGKDPVHEKDLAYGVVTKLMEGYSGKGIQCILIIIIPVRCSVRIFLRITLTVVALCGPTTNNFLVSFVRSLLTLIGGIAHLCTVETLLF